MLKLLGIILLVSAAIQILLVFIDQPGETRMDILRSLNPLKWIKQTASS